MTYQKKFVAKIVSSASFSDVEETHEFTTYIEVAVEIDYMQGYAAGT